MLSIPELVDIKSTAKSNTSRTLKSKHPDTYNAIIAIGYESFNENFFIYTNNYIPVCQLCYKKARWNGTKYSDSCSRLCCNRMNGRKAGYNTEEDIRNDLASEGFILTSEYKNIRTHITYTCPEGHNGSILYNNWQAGGRCGHPDCIKKRITTTCLEKYGVDNPAKAPEVRAKMRKAQSSPETREKSRLTSQANWGTDNPMQNPEVFTRNQESRFSSKEYTMPSGQVRLLQGYEPQAMDMLLNVYTEDQIVSNAEDMPEIVYNGVHRYFPDFYIPHENRIIEIKSSYTITISPDIIEAKKQATEKLGYVYDIWVL